MKTTNSWFWTSTMLGLLGLTACGSMPHPAAQPAMESSRAPAPAPALERSLFSRDITGAVSEADLQRILDARMDISFPMRIGVVSLAEPFHAEAGSSVSEQGIMATALTRSIKGSTRFSHVTDVSTDLPNPQGLEGLRTIAARYRLRYLLLCTARSEDKTHLNNWAWLYPTLVGILLAPGVSVESQGMLQASLFDVKTGTVLFTVTEPYDSSSVTWVIGAGRQQAKNDGDAMNQAAERLARGILTQTETVASWAAEETAQGSSTDSATVQSKSAKTHSSE